MKSFKIYFKKNSPNSGFHAPIENTIVEAEDQTSALEKFRIDASTSSNHSMIQVERIIEFKPK